MLWKQLNNNLTILFQANLDEVGYNDSIKESMEKLLKDLHPKVAKPIRLGHF